MKNIEGWPRVQAGTRLQMQERTYTVVGFAGGDTALLEDEDGGMASVLLRVALTSKDVTILGVDGRVPPVPTSVRLQGLDDERKRIVERLAADLHEVEYGKRPDAPEGSDPDPAYDPSLPKMERQAAKLAELAERGTPMGKSTFEAKLSSWRLHGIDGLIDGRWLRTPDGPRVDERVREMTETVLRGRVNMSTVPKQVLRQEVEIRLADTYRDDDDPPKMPSRSTFNRLLDHLDPKGRATGKATTRRSLDRIPKPTGRRVQELRPGEIVELDSSRLDVEVLFGDGVVGRPELTIAMDLATRSLCSWQFTPSGTDQIDVSNLIVRAMCPEPVRPGWDEQDTAMAGVMPYKRLAEQDERLAGMAAKPIIIPESIVFDNGKQYKNEHVREVCERLGISPTETRPYTPTDKPKVERAFGSIRNGFSAYLPGYTSYDVTMRGRKRQRLLTIWEVETLFAEWVVCYWQQKPHEGLRSAANPTTKDLSPNQMWESLINFTGYVPVPLTGDQYIALLKRTRRTVQMYGINLFGRTYSSRALRGDPFNKPAPLNSGGWDIHYDPADITRIWIHDPFEDQFHEVAWVHARMVDMPVTDALYRYVRQTLKHVGANAELRTAKAITRLATQAGRMAASDKERAAWVESQNRRGHQPYRPESPGPEGEEAAETDDASDGVDLSQVSALGSYNSEGS